MSAADASRGGKLGGLAVVVVGLGPMGRGIARCFDRTGAAVKVVDVDAETTARQVELLRSEVGEDAPPPAVEAGESLTAAVDGADLVIEAVAEKPELKAALLGRIAEAASSSAVVASNTSSLSIGELGVAFGDPARLVGMHFFNPAEKMRLVEVVRGPRTDPTVVDRARAWVEALGKTPVVCADSPNFIVNRVCRPLYYEAQLLVGQGVAPAVVDAVARGALGHRMGPLELLDFTGLHTHLGSSETALREFGDPRYRPIPIARALVRAGATGRDAGQGFYDYAEAPPKVARPAVTREPGEAPGQRIAVTGPGARQLLAHPAIAARADAVAPLTVYSAPSACGREDVATVRELMSTGTRVFVDSSHPGWLTGLPQGAGWLRLHAEGEAPFAEVVVDPEAGIEAAAATGQLLDAIGAPSVEVLGLAGLVADRLQYTLVNEAVGVVEEGTADEEAVNLALKLGMNHPRGPLEVLAARGETTVLAGLQAMQEWLGDPRYRPAALLTRRAAAKLRRGLHGSGDSFLRLPI
ncbi:MAG: 3-hydroxyacyl-CoA dehydrogenase NAD-binding domain-containing protein [Solirubrobacterales bacterium]